MTKKKGTGFHTGPFFFKIDFPDSISEDRHPGVTYCDRHLALILPITWIGTEASTDDISGTFY
jgi:hypothetical protein